MYIAIKRKRKKKKRMRWKGREQRRVYEVIRVCQRRSQNSQFSGLVDPQKPWSPQLLRPQVPRGLCTAPSTLWLLAPSDGALTPSGGSFQPPLVATESHLPQRQLKHLRDFRHTTSESREGQWWAHVQPYQAAAHHSALHHIREGLGIIRTLDFPQEARNPDFYVYYFDF